MKNGKLSMILAVVGLLGAGYGLYSLGVSRGTRMAAPSAAGPASAVASANASAAVASGVDPQTGRKVLYWYDPMTPAQKFDKPGKSPFMDMQLVPRYADDATDSGDAGKLTISPGVRQNLGIRTAEVAKASLASVISAPGSVAYNERNVALVQARGNGFLERLYLRAVLDPVRQGQPLAELYVPDWVAAQEEYLSARRIGAGVPGLADAARQRMRLAGMSDEQIGLVDASGKVHPRLTITAPIGGIVTELTAREGMTVASGAPLFKINGLDTIWVYAEVQENAAAQLRPGVPVEARSASLPGMIFKGTIGALLPEVNPATRTLKARIELANPERRLAPGMFMTVALTPGAGAEVLTAPTEAVIRTGQRSVVMLALEDGRFAPVDVETGREVNGQTEILKGLQAGQKVVVSGQFLIDSEASLKGTATRMSEIPASTSGQSPTPGAAK